MQEQEWWSHAELLAAQKKKIDLAFQEFMTVIIISITQMTQFSKHEDLCIASGQFLVGYLSIPAVA